MNFVLPHTKIKNIIIFFFLIALNNCTDKKLEVSSLLETCADNMLYKEFESKFPHSTVGDWKKIEPTIKKIIELDLNSKLNNYSRHELKENYSNGVGVMIVTYENYFERCEREQNEFPIKFKEKYINYQIPYKNWDEFFAPKK